jgi:hypothetical protein
MRPATNGLSLVGVSPLHLGALEQNPQVLKGIHSWAGVLQLEILSPEVCYTDGHKQGNFQEVMEGKWIQAGVFREIKMEIAQLAVFVMVGYARELRGEEIPKLEITGLLKHFSEGDKNTPKHIMLSLVGMFNQDYGERRHYLPVAVEMGTDLCNRDCIIRILELKVRSGQTQCFYFEKNGSRAKLEDFDEPLIERLVSIQENTEGLIPMIIVLWEVVGYQRSMRRGATAEALNMEVDASWIDANNGWRKFERAKGKMPSISMRKLYTEMLQNLKYELKFSLEI